MIYCSLDLDHLQEIVSLDERTRRSIDTTNTQRMSLPCKHRSRAVIKSASASGLSLMIPSGILFTICMWIITNACQAILQTSF